MPDRLERLDYAELWMRDGIRILRAPGGFGSFDVDMTASLEIVEAFKASGTRINCNHVVFRAVALALFRHPEVHKLGAGSKVLYPSTVDLGISIAAESFVAPVMVIRDAAAKSISTIARESIALIRRAKADDRKLRMLFRRWGWLLPMGWMRRAVLGVLFDQPWFRRGGVGTFQISCLPGLDVVCPFLFNTAGILGVGAVVERPVVLNGDVVVRPMLTLTCTFNHEVWDGRMGVVFLSELRKILESGELYAETEPTSSAVSA